MSSVLRNIKTVGKKVLSRFYKINPNFSAKILFLMRVHKWPNLKNPRTFNEKTTWLKLNNYNKNNLVSKCADKYAVREYVKSKGCGEILNELYGAYDDFDKIDFNKLPNKFALKCVHGCAYNIIVDDKSKFDADVAHKKIQKWQKEKYGYATTELHYTKIRPRIIIEKYLPGENGKMPLDYKFYCMNGKMKCILVCSERDEKLKLSYYDKNWKRLPYEKPNWSAVEDIEKPKNLKKMIGYAEKLSGGFPFVRVDLYNDDGKIIFGELTFTPACSCAPYYNKSGDRELGNMLELKKICSISDIQHIVAAVGKDGCKLASKMRLVCNAVIANQNEKEESIMTKKTDFGELKIINTKTVGVGKNRNIGLIHADADICILSDEDVVYRDDYIQKIANVFNKIKDADVVIFDIDKINSRWNAKPINKIKRLNSLNYMKYGGSRFVFKRQSIQRENIWFTELFGGGSMYSSGEDTVFLSDCVRKGLHVYIVPDVIATVDFGVSSWYRGTNSKFFYDKGALLYKVAPHLCFALAFYFAKKFNSDLKYPERLRLLFAGMRGYKMSRPFDDYCKNLGVESGARND